MIATVVSMSRSPGSGLGRVLGHDRRDRRRGLLAQAVDRLAGDRVRDVPGQEAKDRRVLGGEDEEGVDAGAQPLLVGRRARRPRSTTASISSCR